MTSSDPADSSDSFDTTEPEPDFVVGERVLVYFRQTLNRAKIRQIRKYNDSPDDTPFYRYYVHYIATGPDSDWWKDKWDEWITTMRIVEGNHNRILLEHARRVSSTVDPRIFRPSEETRHPTKNKENNEKNGIWIDPIYKEKEDIDTKLGTSLPTLLFIRMIQDRELCLHAGLILRLPHRYTIDNIVQQFKSYLEEKKRPRMVAKLVNKWVDYFDTSVSKYLFESEHHAFDTAKLSIGGPQGQEFAPSELYGVEHLVSLLVALPKSLLVYRGINKKDIVQTLADFFSFLVENDQIFYHVKSGED